MLNKFDELMVFKISKVSYFYTLIYDFQAVFKNPVLHQLTGNALFSAQK